MDDLKGTTTINGLTIGHTTYEVATILHVCRLWDIKKFIEIGVHVGGLAKVLTTKLPEMKYLGIEENPYLVHDIVRNSGLTFIFDDCFNPTVVQKVQLFMHHIGGHSLIYCDDGNKPKEIMRYYPIVEVDDLILVHDYYDRIRKPYDLAGYGIDLEFPKPEIYPEDLEKIKKDTRFVELGYPTLNYTRIAGFMRIR